MLTGMISSIHFLGMEEKLEGVSIHCNMNLLVRVLLASKHAYIHTHLLKTPYSSSLFVAYGMIINHYLMSLDCLHFLRLVVERSFLPS